MTAIDVTPAVQAAAEALWVTEHFPVDDHDLAVPSADHPDFVRMEVMTYPSADAAITAALPHLAEQFALLLEGEAERDGDWIGDVSPDAITRRCARLIREAATKTDDGAAPVWAGQSQDGVHLPTPDGETAPSSPDRIEAVSQAFLAADWTNRYRRDLAAVAVAALDAYDREHPPPPRYPPDWRDEIEADLRERLAAEVRDDYQATVATGLYGEEFLRVYLAANETAARIVRGGA